MEDNKTLKNQFSSLILGFPAVRGLVHESLYTGICTRASIVQVHVRVRDR